MHLLSLLLTVLCVQAVMILSPLPSLYSNLTLLAIIGIAVGSQHYKEISVLIFSSNLNLSKVENM